MKNFIALMAILASTTAFATENLEFGDLNYFLKQGQLNAKADFVLSTIERKIAPGAGSSTKIEREGYTLETDYGFGVMDNLNVYLGLDYDYEMKINDNVNSKYTQDGLKDPSLSANFRLIDQKDSAVNFDIGAIARYSWEDREDGASLNSKTKDGNAVSGRTSVELNTAVGRKWNEANEWRLSAGLVHFTEGERDDLNIGSGKTKVDMESSQDIFVRAAYQYRPVQEFMMGFAITGTQIGEAEEKSGGVKSTIEDHMVYDFTFTAKYLVTESMIVRFAMNEGNNPDYDIKSGGSTTEVKNIRASFMSLGVDFLF